MVPDEDSGDAVVGRRDAEEFIESDLQRARSQFTVVVGFVQSETKMPFTDGGGAVAVLVQ